MKYVLGGSRHIQQLSTEVKDLLNGYIDKNYEFLIGDAPGSDTAFQAFFVQKKYLRVKIYSSAGYIRSNLGNWDWELIDSGLKSKSNAVHAFKDRKMCELADSGLMLWDCQSAGTLSNVIDLITLGKTCGVWVGPEFEFYRFDNPKSFDSWVNLYPEVKEEASKRLAKFYKRLNKRKSTTCKGSVFLPGMDSS